MVKLPEIIRKQTSIVQIGNVQIGGGLPVVVQSMTNTDTANAITTAANKTLRKKIILKSIIQTRKILNDKVNLF